MNIIHIESRDQPQNAPYPFTTFALYHNGEFVTHEIQSVPKFEKLWIGIVKTADFKNSQWPK